MNCCFKFLKGTCTWRYAAGITHTRNRSEATSTTVLTATCYTRRFYYKTQLPALETSNPEGNRFRPDKKSNEISSIKKIDLDFARKLFNKDIGISLMTESRLDEISSNDIDVAWLVSDSRRESIFRKLRGLEITQVISLFQELRTKNNDDHRNAFLLEEYLTSNVKSLDIKTCLLFSEVMILSGFRGYKFLGAFFEHLSYHVDLFGLESQHIPRLMFLIFFHGSAPVLLLSKLEEVIYDNFNSLTLKDLSVICLGYFRGHRRIHSYKLLDRIADKTIEDISQIDEQQLTNILKSFRHSGYLKASFYSLLADSLSSKQEPERVLRLNTVMHLLMVFASLKIYHKPLLEYLAGRTNKILEQSWTRGWTLRSKELAKITWAIGTFCHWPDQWRRFSRNILTSFRKNVNTTDGSQYPESIADMVQGLIYMDVFPEDLMQQILKSEVADGLRGMNLMIYKIVELL